MKRPHPRHRHHRRRRVQGLRAVHRRLPAARAGDDRADAERAGLPLPAAAAGLHRVPGVPADLPRLRVRGVPSTTTPHRDRATPGWRVTIMTSPPLMEGSEAIAEAAIAAGCRFFAGYPMTPFTELLEHIAKQLPEVGGVCINAESELEAVGMAGARRRPAPAPPPAPPARASRSCRSRSPRSRSPGCRW